MESNGWFGNGVVPEGTENVIDLFAGGSLGSKIQGELREAPAFDLFAPVTIWTEKASREDAAR